MTWDSIDLVGMTLSDADLIATNTAGSNHYINGSYAKSRSFKYYFELETTNLVDDGVILGVELTGHTSFSGGDDLGNITSNSGLTSYFGLTNNTHFGFCLDLDNNQFYLVSDVTKIGINSQGYWNGDPTANPSTNTGGLTLAAGLQEGPTKPMFFAPNGGSQTCQIYTESTSFIISAIPTGYLQWNIPLTIGRNHNKTYRTR
jgi:hypothetical protein